MLEPEKGVQSCAFLWVPPWCQTHWAGPHIHSRLLALILLCPRTEEDFSKKRLDINLLFYFSPRFSFIMLKSLHHLQTNHNVITPCYFIVGAYYWIYLRWVGNCLGSDRCIFFLLREKLKFLNIHLINSYGLEMNKLSFKYLLFPALRLSMNTCIQNKDHAL